jgi:hypothetical protein
MGRKLQRVTGAVVQILSAPNMGRSMNMTDEEARESWAKLETAMKHIHEQNASHLSFEELYRTAYTLVLHRHGQLLYNGFETSLRKHLQGVRAKFKDKSGMAFVTEVLAQWTSYHKSTQMIRDILMVRFLRIRLVTEHAAQLTSQLRACPCVH